MQYNLFISCKLGNYNLFGITLEQVNIVTEAYFLGKPKFTIAGKTCQFDKISSFQIFQHDAESDPIEASEYYLGNINFREKDFNHYYLPPSTLLKMGKNVTVDFIGNSEYGEKAKVVTVDSVKIYKEPIISLERIRNLKSIQSEKFDLIRLIKLCEEINDNYFHENYMAVAMIGRTILNHIPPIFGHSSFEEVANNYGGSQNSSFKKNMNHLNHSLKNIADGYLHQQIRKKESLPNEIQVNFKQDLDVLVSEIIRIIK